MKATGRHFVGKLTLALLTMIMFSLVLFGSAGWLVTRRYEWVGRVIGQPRAYGLRDWYARVAEGLGPGDRDGDGVPDGAEWFANTDPGNALNHKPISILPVGPTLS